MKTPKILLGIYILIFIWSAINPTDRGVWWVEAITSLIPVVLVWIAYIKGIKLSSLAYVFLSVLPIMHVIGAHYTFAEVPFDWFNNLFGFERNMYDRVAHMTVGFYALGIIEALQIKNVSNKRWFAVTYALFAIMALAGLYELFEWLYAILGDPNAGIAVLGAQGDIWDAQKDILMDTLGAVISVIVFYVREFFKKTN
jgi:putative membrane protein